MLNIEKSIEKYYQKYGKAEFRGNRWRENNPERDKRYRDKERINERNKNRPRISLKCSLNNKINNIIWRSLRGSKNNRHLEILVSYTHDDLIRSLKETIPKGYTWQDYLDGKLHIDHIIPIKVFNFNHSEDLALKKCWALSNLRLLPARENISKGSKLIEYHNHH